MATKCLKITSETITDITQPNTTVSNVVVAFGGPTMKQDYRGITTSCEPILYYFLNEAALDDSDCKPLQWNIPDLGAFDVTEEDWDSSTKSPNDMLYDKLKTLLTDAGHAVTILTK